MKTLERVARAIAENLKEQESLGLSVGISDDGITANVDGYFELKAVARAALTALLEPSEEMYEAAVQNTGMLLTAETRAALKQVFGDMIQQALKEGEEG